MKILTAIIFSLFLAAIAGCSFQKKKEAFVLPAHAHNDYEHERPLLEALDCNFKSIEADVFSIGDSLFVAHDYEDITPGKTLRNLYLEPLKKRIRENRGSVYGNGEELILLIDIKDDGLKTYKLLHNVLEEYKEIVSCFEGGRKKESAILVIISGNRPFEFMMAQDVRYAGLDGRIVNLDSGIESGLMPMISDNWINHFSWDGTGEMPQEERNKLNEFSAKAKNNGFILRWWGTPSRTYEQEKNVWQALLNARVGLIGTDNIRELQHFYLQEQQN